MAGNISGNGFEQIQDQKLHFLDYWRVIQKRKEAIIAVVIILVLVTALLSLMQQKQYIAKATLQLSPKEKAIDPFQTHATPIMVDPQQISTVISEITLPNVLRRVIKGEIWTDAKKYRCRVHGDLELDEVRIAGTGTICPKPLCNEKLTTQKVKEYPDWQPLTKKWSARYKKEYTENELVYELQKKVKAKPVRGTHLIQISFQSELPKESAQIATMVAKAYVQFRNEKQEDKLKQAMNILDEEIESFKYGDPEKDKKGLIDLEDQLDALAEELGVSPEESSLLSPAIIIQDYKRRRGDVEFNLVAIEK